MTRPDDMLPTRTMLPGRPGCRPREAMTRPTPDPLRAADTDLDDDMGDMCPNCITPWKCNGPHLVAETPYMRRLLAVRTGGGCLLVLLVAAASWWLR